MYSTNRSTITGNLVAHACTPTPSNASILATLLGLRTTDTTLLWYC